MLFEVSICRNGHSKLKYRGFEWKLTANTCIIISQSLQIEKRYTRIVMLFYKLTCTGRKLLSTKSVGCEGARVTACMLATHAALRRASERASEGGVNEAPLAICFTHSTVVAPPPPGTASAASRACRLSACCARSRRRAAVGVARQPAAAPPPATRSCCAATQTRAAPPPPPSPDLGTTKPPMLPSYVDVAHKRHY